VGPEDPRPVVRDPPGTQPAPARPVAELPARHPELSPQVGHPPFVLPQQSLILSAIAQPPARHQLPHRQRRVAPGRLRRSEALRVEPGRDLTRRIPLAVQTGEPIEQPGVVAQVLVELDRADDLVTAREAPTPIDLHVYIFAVLADMDDHALDQQADDLLPLGWRRRRGVPEGWDIAGQGGDPGEFVLAQLGRLVPSESVIFFFELALTAQGLLPATLQCPGDQTVLRFDGVVLPLGPPRFVTRSLQLLLPVAVEAIALPADVPGRLEAQLQSGGFQGSNDLTGHEVIDRRCPQAMTARSRAHLQVLLARII